ncbi:MAG: anaerobic ribonucleoside-triphosphate reductase activating protein [Candidatus Hydrothermarchaeales archaeon]
MHDDRAQAASRELDMNIRGFIDTSFVDWDKKVSCVVFTGGCNLRCSFCYNFGLVFHPEKFEEIPEDFIFEYLREHSDFIDGVCITGGEPTVQSDLVEFCRKIKHLELDIKLDTNGTQPKNVEQLLKEKLVDYVAMDVKAPLEEKSYSTVAGVTFNGSFGNIKETIDIVINSDIDHEFRTTVIPNIHTKKDIEDISKSITGAKRYYLQKFQPHTRFDNLNKNKTQSDEEMEELVKVARRHVANVEWRGR